MSPPDVVSNFLSRHDMHINHDLYSKRPCVILLLYIHTLSSTSERVGVVLLV